MCWGSRSTSRSEPSSRLIPTGGDWLDGYRISTDSQAPLFRRKVEPEGVGVLQVGFPVLQGRAGAALPFPGGVEDFAGAEGMGCDEIPQTPDLPILSID